MRVERGLDRDLIHLNAYDTYLRGRWFADLYTKDGYEQAHRLFERAIELDPNFAAAHASLSLLEFFGWEHELSADVADLAHAFELARKAVSLDETLPVAHAVLGWMHLWWERDHDKAIAEAELAVTLDPNDAVGHAWLAEILTLSGRPGDAFAPIQKALRLDPQSSTVPRWTLAHAYYQSGRHDQAAKALQEVAALNPRFQPARLILVSAYAETGRDEEARAEAGEIMKLWPDISLAAREKRWPFKNRATLERIMVNCRNAGLPE